MSKTRFKGLKEHQLSQRLTTLLNLCREVQDDASYSGLDCASEICGNLSFAVSRIAMSKDALERNKQ